VRIIVHNCCIQHNTKQCWLCLPPDIQHNSDAVYYARVTVLIPELPGWAGTRKVKPIWILLKQETVTGSGINNNNNDDDRLTAFDPGQPG